MRIFVRQLAFEGYHGVFEEERREGRSFEVDLEVRTDQDSAADSDRLDDTLDYRGLAQIIGEVADGPSRYLVEKLAGEIVDRTLERYPQVVEATVEVRKQAPNVQGSPRWVGVGLTRRRQK